MSVKEIITDAFTGLVGGFFSGGFLGWLFGLAIFYLWAVPEAAKMDRMVADSYLCGAGSALPMLAIPGALIGSLVGSIWMLVHKNKCRLKQEIRR